MKMMPLNRKTLWIGLATVIGVALSFSPAIFGASPAQSDWQDVNTINGVSQSIREHVPQAPFESALSKAGIPGQGSR